jgi:hypothetical protein
LAMEVLAFECALRAFTSFLVYSFLRITSERFALI